MTDRTKRLAVFFLAAMCLIHAGVFWSLRNQLRAGYPDFSIFYAAGKIVRQGMASQLYDVGLQFRMQQEFAPHVEIRLAALPYNHPPFEALLFAPLTWLPYFSAYLLWDLVNIVMLMALPFLLRPFSPAMHNLPGALWLLLALAFFPVFVDLLQGQDSILLLLLLTLSFVAFKRDAEFLAGCWLGLGLFRFQLLLPILLVLLLHKKQRAMAGLAAVGVFLALISIAVVGWKEALAYPVWVWKVETVMGQGTALVANMPNLRGLVQLVGLAQVSETAARAVIAVLSVTLLLISAIVGRFATRDSRFDVSFGLAVVTAVLVSYHALPHDLSLLLLPVLLLGNHLERARGWTRFALLAPVLVVFFTPVSMWLWFRYGQVGWLAVVLLLWWWGIAAEVSQETRSPGGPVTAESA